VGLSARSGLALAGHWLPAALLGLAVLGFIYFSHLF
jgi:hypothetical protein